MKRIRPGIIVKGPNGKSGVTVPDFMSCCSEEETPVVWDGEGAFIGMDRDALEVIGPENPQANLLKCGAGQGEKCCIFLTVGAQGPNCERHTSMRYDLIFRSDRMTAKRQPTEMYPRCQIFGDKEKVI